jgi:hypothetical protein
MRISEFFGLEGEYQISATDVQNLNIEFSKASIDDIPSDRVSAACDYICTVLLHSAVDPTIVDSLAKLLEALQEKPEKVASSVSS